MSVGQQRNESQVAKRSAEKARTAENVSYLKMLLSEKSNIYFDAAPLHQILS